MDPGLPAAQGRGGTTPAVEWVPQAACHGRTRQPFAPQCHDLSLCLRVQAGRAAVRPGGAAPQHRLTPSTWRSRPLRTMRSKTPKRGRDCKKPSSPPPTAPRAAFDDAASCAPLDEPPSGAPGRVGRLWQHSLPPWPRGATSMAATARSPGRAGRPPLGSAGPGAAACPCGRRGSCPKAPERSASMIEQPSGCPEAFDRARTGGREAAMGPPACCRWARSALSADMVSVSGSRGDFRAGQEGARTPSGECWHLR